MSKVIEASGYLCGVVTSEGMTKSVNRLVRNLKHLKDNFDAIAFRGMSGALIAPNVAQRLRKDVIAVRKDERHHSSRDIEGVMCSRYVIIDDFIDGGTTVKEIHEKIQSWDKRSKLVGVALYNTDDVSDMATQFLKKHDGVWILHNGVKCPVYPQVAKVK